MLTCSPKYSCLMVGSFLHFMCQDRTFTLLTISAWLPEGRALSARRLLLVVQRRAQDDPAIDRHHFQLKRYSLAVAVEPRGSDAGPKALFALVGDMPGEEVRRIGLLRGCGTAACHDDFLSCLVARCAKLEGRTAKGRIHVQHG